MIRIGLLTLLSLCTLWSATSDGQEPKEQEGNPFLSPRAADVGWWHIRGANFDGHSAEINIADRWPAEGPPVLWVKELGQGYSSIVVKDDRAYTQYQSLGGQFVICMDASSGETIWQHRYDWPFEATGLYPGPRSTPTIYHDKVYFSAPSGSVGCLDLAGRLIWQQDLKTKFDGRGTDFGYACSPTLIDDKIIMPVGGKGASMVALDAESGEVLWKSGDFSASYTPAYPITAGGHAQVIGYMEHDLVSFDLESGEQLWRQNLSHGYDEHSAWPIYGEGHLWTAAPFQAGSQLLKLSSGDGAGTENVWQKSVMSNDVSSSVLVDGFLYGFDLVEAQSKAHRPSRGSFRCVDFMTGETMWSNGNAKKRRSTDYESNAANQTVGHANVIVADGKLILFNDLGDLILAKVDSEKYVELARTPALGGEICWTTPALDRGRIFLRNHSRAVCLYIGKPELMERASGENLLSVNDIPQGPVTDLSSILGVEPEYAMDPPTWRWLKSWYLVSLAILGVSGLIGSLVSLRVSVSSVRWCFWLSAMTLGAVTGMIASRAANDFVFTWPVVIFIAFQIAISHASLRRSDRSVETKSVRWRDRFIAVGFIAICVGYFFACRRLSLVTEWVFLCGFAAAAPMLVLNRVLSKKVSRRSLLLQFAVTLVAHFAFHWSTALLLSMKYDLSSY